MQKVSLTYKEMKYWEGNIKKEKKGLIAWNLKKTRNLSKVLD